MNALQQHSAHQLKASLDSLQLTTAWGNDQMQVGKALGVCVQMSSDMSGMLAWLRASFLLYGLSGQILMLHSLEHFNL